MLWTHICVVDYKKDLRRNFEFNELLFIKFINNDNLNVLVLKLWWDELIIIAFILINYLLIFQLNLWEKIQYSRAVEALNNIMAMLEILIIIIKMANLNNLNDLMSDFQNFFAWNYLYYCYLCDLSTNFPI